MKAILKKVGEPAKVIDTVIDLDFMQATVGGDIQMVPIGPQVDIVCNEEGMWAGPDGTPLPPNAAGCLGNILIVAVNVDGDERGLTDEEIRKGLAYLERFADAQHPSNDGSPLARLITGKEGVDIVLKHKAMTEKEIWESL